MTESKLAQEKEWKAIDIFLFNNGEQSSPPRKHHLDTDSLMMWNGTLRNLGHTHFGPDTVVDLYTMDGHKIDDPSQLIHQAAYVAVKPPCTFIQAGYQNYLIKATRSWEKTLLRMSNSMESTNKGCTDNDLLNFQNNDSPVHVKGQNNETEQMPKSTIKNERSIVRPCIVNVKTPREHDKPVKCLETIKQTQRKKTYHSPQSSSQARSSFKITPSSKRMLIKTKESFHKSSLDTKKKIPCTTDRKELLRACRFNHYNNNVVPSTTIANFNVMEKKLEDTAGSKAVNIPNTNHYETYNDVAHETTLNEKKIVISNIFENVENEIKSVAAVISDETENHSNLFSTRNENKEITSDVTTDSSVKKSNIDTIHKCYETRKQLDQFVSILNDDKVLKLQLNLEINNCNVSITTDQINTTNEALEHRTEIREEKETQVNIYELSNTIHSQITQQHIKELPQKVDELVKTPIKDENKIIIINCSCCDCMRLHNLFQSNAECNKSYNEQILSQLETLVVVKETKKCDCDINSLNENTNAIINSKLVNTPNLESNEEKTLKATPVHKLSLHNVESVTFINDSSKQENLICNKIDLEEQQNVYAKESFHKIINTNTQTNWCDLMLEARVQEDGRYTFHLPPLHKIKNLP